MQMTAAKSMMVGALTLAMVASFGQAAAVTPVEKVITMLTEMEAAGTKSMASEKTAFASYKVLVEDTSTQLEFAIKTSKSEIESLTATIEGAESDVQVLSNEISKLEADIATNEGEIASANAMRAAQKADFEKVEKDLSESVDALEMAIQTLQSKNYDVPQAESLLQQMAVKTMAMRPVVASLLELKDQANENSAPEVAAYEFQSAGIVGTLESLLKKFKGQLAEKVDIEGNQAHVHSLQVLELTDTISFLKSDLEEKTVAKGKKAALSASSQAELATTKAKLAEDEKLLAEMSATFEAKWSVFEANQKVRAEELDALSQAISIMKDKTVAGSYKEHINFIQKPAPTSFLQLRSSRSRVTSRQHVVSLLQKRAKALGSKALASLASEISANPFGKVIEMIESLLKKMKEEAAAEADHKAWCDEQLKSNKAKRAKKTSKVNQLTAEIDELTATIDTMAKDIAELMQEQADLGKTMAEMTEVRTAEKTRNTKTIKDADAGVVAVKDAISILKEFYAGQAALLQQPVEGPEIVAYKGMQETNTGVVGMLEVILTDFSRLSAETTASETEAAAEYKEEMSEMTASKEKKHELEVQLSLDKDQKEFEKGETEKDLAATSAELDQANKYFESLKPVCLTVHVSYEERAAKREEELAALKEAYEVLDQKSG
mmetsp:Transcript_131001/g.245187  ORF Transcript_131001/g.245187 Transcript_131001/m.245187 type:complete len:664 (+) Transcript_131001:29-2020(+)